MPEIAHNQWTEKKSVHEISGYQLDSAILGDRLEISVSTPPAVASGNGALPTLYVLDPFITMEMAVGISRLFASFSGGEIPPALVVGVGYPTLDPRQVMGLRARDLTPTAQGFPAEMSITPPFGLGGAERFLRTLIEEVIPGIEARYPVHPTDRTLIGLSFSGLFGLYVLFHRPETFSRYLLVSPSIWWDQTVSFTYEQAWAKQHADLPARLFLAVGAGEEKGGGSWLNENIPDKTLYKLRQVGNLQKLADRLKSRGYPSLIVNHRVFPNEYHLSVLPAALSQGMRHLFSEDNT